jgi:hypothetical protein
MHSLRLAGGAFAVGAGRAPAGTATRSPSGRTEHGVGDPVGLSLERGVDGTDLEPAVQRVVGGGREACGDGVQRARLRVAHGLIRAPRLCKGHRYCGRLHQ